MLPHAGLVWNGIDGHRPNGWRSAAPHQKVALTFELILSRKNAPILLAVQRRRLERRVGRARLV